jgi:hypothetical protein
VSALGAAQDELDRRARIAERADADDRNVMAALASVADYVRRIGDHDSRHYRAEKAGDLVEAALRVERQAVVLYGGGEELADEWVNLIYDLHQVLEAVVGQVSGAMWAAARLHYPYTWQADELRRATRRLTDLANLLCERALTDPDMGS